MVETQDFDDLVRQWNELCQAWVAAYDKFIEDASPDDLTVKGCLDMLSAAAHLLRAESGT